VDTIQARRLTSLSINSLWHHGMVQHFSGFQIDQAEAKVFGTAAQTVDEPCAVEFQISAGPGS
jgi:hypothetical protein